MKGLFFAAGTKPATEFLCGQLPISSNGYLVTEPGSTKTSIPGVFAAGHVADANWHQTLTSVGSGCQAALEAIDYVNALKIKLK